MWQCRPGQPQEGSLLRVSLNGTAPHASSLGPRSSDVQVDIVSPCLLSSGPSTAALQVRGSSCTLYVVLCA